MDRFVIHTLRCTSLLEVFDFLTKDSLVILLCWKLHYDTLYYDNVSPLLKIDCDRRIVNRVPIIELWSTCFSYVLHTIQQKSVVPQSTPAAVANARSEYSLFWYVWWHTTPTHTVTIKLENMLVKAKKTPLPYCTIHKTLINFQRYK